MLPKKKLEKLYKSGLSMREISEQEDWSNPKIVEERVDVNDNARIDFDDATVINNYAQQEIDTFPVCSTGKLEGVKTQLASLESVLSNLSDVLKRVIQD